MAKSVHVFFTDRDEIFELDADNIAAHAEQFTDYIIKTYQNAYVEDVLEKEYGLKQKNEQMFIIGNIHEQNSTQILHQMVYEQIFRYLESCDVLNIEGFVKFRLQAYTDLLDDMIEQAVNAYMAEIEYNQLIAYLTMYVNMQKPLIHKILITAENGRYIVYNETYQEIISLTDFEDTMLDILITLSPEIIYIYHVKEFQNRQLLKTICKIFKTRVCAFEGDIPESICASRIHGKKP